MIKHWGCWLWSFWQYYIKYSVCYQLSNIIKSHHICWSVALVGYGLSANMISNIRQILALPPALVADRWGNHRFGIFSVSIICVYCALHCALWSKGWHFWRGCYGQNGSQNIRYDIYFYDFCNKHPFMEKKRLSLKKILSKYLRFFWML